MIKLRLCAATMAGLVWALPTGAAMHALALEPRSAQVVFRAYGLGVVPIDGAFTRFNGTLLIDPADPAACQIAIQADAASLKMPDAAMTQDALGPDLLEVNRHPAFAYDGQCRDGQVRGALLLHGVTLPLSLTATLEHGRWVATRRVRRAEWGMGARPLLAGPEVRIQFTANLPPNFLTQGFPAKP